MTLAETLAELHAASFPRGWTTHEFETLLANPAYTIITSDHGFAMLQIIPPEAELITISILPTARGMGHGRTLLSRTVEAARTAGATSIFLDVDATNVAAIALYESAGFSEFARRPGYYASEDDKPSDAIQMVHHVSAQ
ncbi:GNAT family N-acetyltransferase [Gymnodinialimonas hymeniacidonis]|uniref:GNAT family N-acetyltransferase n=1 Tax=Gymnodinialimonas hymeniacidonis TaxID=3126508 RepID=UPI0034C6A104